MAILQSVDCVKLSIHATDAEVISDPTVHSHS